MQLMNQKHSNKKQRASPCLPVLLTNHLDPKSLKMFCAWAIKLKYHIVLLNTLYD